MNGQTVALSGAVLEQFRTHEAFERGTAQTVGMLLGRIESEKQVSVHYAPPLLQTVPQYPLAHSYAFGRVEATLEAAWHLCGWTGLGYWIAHDGPEMEPQRLVRFLGAYLPDELSLQELILVVLVRTPSGLVEIYPYTYVSRVPLISWRRLELIHLSSGSILQILRDKQVPENQYASIAPESQSESKDGKPQSGEGAP